jgi:hypothetical protein
MRAAISASATSAWCFLEALHLLAKPLQFGVTLRQIGKAGHNS